MLNTMYISICWILQHIRKFMQSFLFQAQVEATDYLLSGDYKYIAFESNYTKVRC